MITQANWRKYIDRLAAIDKKAADLMQMYIDEHGLQDTEALIQYAYSLVTKYGETSATLASEMYDHMADIMNANVPEAIPAETASLKEIAKGVTWGKYHSPSQIPSVVGRQVRQAGADTMIQNAKRDKAQWAWVPQGDTCAFCITLASRGWQDASKTVLKGNHADHIHQNCDCTFAIAFKEKDKRQYDYIYDPDKYLEMYDEAGGDINAMRRQIYAKNKDEINAQKRDAYKARNMVVSGTSDSSEVSAPDSISVFKNAYFGLPESMRDLPKIKGNPKLKELIEAVNPYDGERHNCVSCSAAFALRLQGIDAISIKYAGNQLDNVTYPWKLWKLPSEPKSEIYSELKNSIEKDMEKWGDGAICQIPMTMNIGGHTFGHMITAFQYGNQTYFIDPQFKIFDASSYFDYLLSINPDTESPAGYYYYRVDGVELSEIGKKMVKFNYDNI